MTRSMDMECTDGLMGEHTLAVGRMESSMDMESMLFLTVALKRDNGTWGIDSNGMRLLKMRLVVPNQSSSK